MKIQSKLVQKDPWLEPYSDIINARSKAVHLTMNKLTGNKISLSKFASGYFYYGLHKTEQGWVFREWSPNAKKIYLIGEFNDWKEDEEYSLNLLTEDNWEVHLEEDKIKHGQKYKLRIYWHKGSGDRIPSYATRCVQDENTKLFDAQVWETTRYSWKNPSPRGIIKNPFIYEAHVGMSTEGENIGTFIHFKEKILPRIKDLGYNTVQLMAIQEHPYYGSFGYHVSNFFAVSSRFGTPNELKELIDSAHGMGMQVIMDIVHSHSVKNELEGLALFDGDPGQYFHTGSRREHKAWDSLCFDYGKDHVMHFLLSNCRFWLEEYNFDGFRFDGVTSMLYYDHGLSRDFTSYDFYYNGNQDGDAINYLSLMNLLVHEVKPNAITIAEEMSGMPGIAEPVENGGMGFDYRIAMGIPDYWIKTIKEKSDENWDVASIYHELTSRRDGEKTISYSESHDQALVGDKTIIFRLLDEEMYWHMNKDSKNINIDRGIALHKMIRLATFATNGGGYLNFMGNEFGHPDWIDFPRKGNNWSYKYAQRQWSLADNKNLRYHWLQDFEREMLKLNDLCHFLDEKWSTLRCSNIGDQVLAFDRGFLLFIFNFSPKHAYTDYGIAAHPGKYNLILSTDSSRFGGYGNIDEATIYISQRVGGASGQDWLKVYLPPRTAIVLNRRPTRSVYDAM